MTVDRYKRHIGLLMGFKPASAMKLILRRTPHHHHHHHHHQFKHYYRWILWVSLSLYFLYFLYFLYSTFLFPTPSPTSLPKTALQYKTTRRALVHNLQEPPSSLNIYVYDLPPEYNADWLSNPRCGSHLFASEVALHEAVLGSTARVSDPGEADFFFVPVYVSCNFSAANGFPSLTHARTLLASAVERVSTRYPFWNRTGGRDHIFVASHDYGACFHAMEDVAVADGIPEFMRNSVLLQTFGVRSPHRCQEAEHVIIPPYVSPDISEWAPQPQSAKRDVWVYFRGKMEVHPKNISGRFYSK